MSNRVQNALEILKDFRPEELRELFQMMPTAAEAAKAVDHVSGTDEGRNEREGKGRKGDAPATAQGSENAGGRASDSDGLIRLPSKPKRDLMAEFIGNLGPGGAGEQGTVPVEGIESAEMGDTPDSRAFATTLLPHLLQRPDVRPGPAPTQSNALPSVTAYQSTTIPEPPLNLPSAPAAAVYPPSITLLSDSVPPLMSEHPAPELCPPQNQPSTTMSVLEGSTDCTFNNTLITNIGRDATFFKFDGSEELFTLI